MPNVTVFVLLLPPLLYKSCLQMSANVHHSMDAMQREQLGKSHIHLAGMRSGFEAESLGSTCICISPKGFLAYMDWHAYFV